MSQELTAHFSQTRCRTLKTQKRHAKDTAERESTPKSQRPRSQTEKSAESSAPGLSVIYEETPDESYQNAEMHIGEAEVLNPIVENRDGYYHHSMVVLYHWQEECLKKWDEVERRGLIEVTTDGGKPSDHFFFRGLLVNEGFFKIIQKAPFVLPSRSI